METSQKDQNLNLQGIKSVSHNFSRKTERHSKTNVEKTHNQTKTQILVTTRKLILRTSKN